MDACTRPFKSYISVLLSAGTVYIPSSTAISLELATLPALFFLLFKECSGKIHLSPQIFDMSSTVHWGSATFYFFTFFLYYFFPKSSIQYVSEYIYMCVYIYRERACALGDALISTFLKFQFPKFLNFNLPERRSVWHTEETNINLDVWHVCLGNYQNLENAYKYFTIKKLV